MRKILVTLLFLFIVILGSGQSVTAPDSKVFLENTLAQNASGFVLSGFESTSTLLTSISLVTFPTGTTFNLTTTTGLTAASGFTLSGNKTRLVVTGTMANINNALASLKINTGATKGEVKISVAATINPSGYFYNGVNGHFYRPISTGATYTNARAAALNTTFKGQTGYLVTITSADEDAFIFANVPQASIWFALTDEASEARWVIDAGPEKGTLIKINNGQTNGNIPGQYNNWAPGEPNNSGNEDYAVTKWGGGSQWNDLPNNFSCAYVIEYGTWTNPDDQTFTEFYTNSTSHSNGQVLKAQFTFNFPSIVDKTKFRGKMYTISNGSYIQATTAAFVPLNGLGKLDMTNDIDTAKVSGNLKPHILSLATTYTQTELNTIYNNIVTLSDVYTAFKEFNNRGILGNQTGLEFTKGIQFINADLNKNGVIDESDCFTLLQQLTGIKSLVNSNNLDSLIRIVPKATYDTTTNSNWSNLTSFYTSKFPANLTANTLNSFDVAVTWAGDIDLAQSTTQTASTVAASSLKSFSTNSTSNEIQASIVTELINDTVYAIIKVNPLQQELVGTQFKLNYDNTVLKFNKVEHKTKGNPTSFGVDKGTYINLGSLITDGSTILDNTTEYKITFTPLIKLDNVLGLMSILMTDAVNRAGNQLKIKVI
jgi:hypothetical protein